MNTPTRLLLIGAALALMPALAVAGDVARDAVLQGNAEQAAAEDPGFAGFSAERGQRLDAGPHQGGNPQMTACAACHTSDPTAEGRHLKTGRAIEPMAGMYVATSSSRARRSPVAARRTRIASR